ncbi:MAG: hypothetical protein ACRC92_18430 [Peptostreptococcaceae bacterium]
MADKYYDENNEELGQIVGKESVMSKFIKAGLVAAAVTTVSKKGSKTWLGKHLAKEPAQYAAIAAGTMALGSDDNVGGDLAVASLFVLGSSGIKTARSMLDTADGMEKVQKNLKKMDQISNDFSLKVFNFNEKVMDTFKDSVSKRAIELAKEPIDEEAPMFTKIRKTMFNQGKMIAGALKDTALAPLDNIKKLGLIEGTKENFRNINNSKIMQQYNAMDDIERTAMIKASNMTKGFTNTDVFRDEPGLVREALGGLAGMFGQDVKKMVTYHDGTFDNNLETLKKLNKIHSIKNDTSFADMGGIYTKYDEVTGKLKLDVRKLGSDESSNFEFVNNLYKNYSKDQRDSMKSVLIKDEFGKPILNEDGKKMFKSAFDTLTNEQKEEGFVKYLKDNGFGTFVEKNYKQKNAVTFGDIDEMFKDKSLKTSSQLNAVESKLDFNFKNKLITEDVYNERKAIVKKQRDTMADEDILEYIHNGLDSKNLKKILKVDAENQYSHGVKNADVLKNFTFTNVVTKNDQFGYADKTALDGGIVALKLAGMVERSFVGSFKLPFQRDWNTWNPVKLIESENRIKTKVANEYNPYGVSSNGFILDGKLIQYQRYEDMDEFQKLPGGKKKLIKKGEKYSEYFSDGKENYKRTFLKQHIDIMDDNYEITKSNEKHINGYRDIYETYKKEGWREALDVASKSHFNPFNLRYDNGKGIRAANPEESYYNEAPIWQSIFNGNTGNSKILNKMDEKGKTTGVSRRVANMVLGQHGDINGRELDIDNNYINKRYENAKEILVSQLIKQNMEKTKALQTSPSYRNKVLTSYGQEGFVQNLVAFSSGTDLLNNADVIYKDASKGIFEKLRKYSEGKVYATDFLDKAEQFFGTGSISGTRYKDAIVDLINKKGDGHEELTKLIGENSDEIKRLFSLGDLKYTAKRGLLLENGTHADLSILSKDVANYMDKVKDNLGIDLLDSWTKNALAFMETQTGKESITRMNSTLSKLGIGDGESAYDFIDNLSSFMKGVDVARDRAANSLGKEILKNQVTSGTDIGDSIIAMLRNGEAQTNELKDAMNLSLGYEYYHLKDNAKASKGLDIMEQLSGAYRGLNLVDEEQSRIANSLISADRSYDKSGIDSMFKKDHNALNKNPKSYGFFKELDEESGIAKGKRHDSYLEAVEIMRRAKYVTRKEQYGASMVIEDSIKNAMEVKSAMDATRKFVQSFMDKNKRSYSFFKATRGSGVKIKSQSKKFGDVDSSFGLFMKTAINKVQGPLEFIGIERMTNQQLGSHWTDQYKNFFKYRYLPLAAVATGYLAADSATDAIVPDDVPIFGNGLTGVATRTYATARVATQYAAKYTGLLSVIKAVDEIIPVDNGLTWMLDLTMDPEEMIDVYFRGKAVRVNKNRNWYTAGRQTGEGEEFGQYRPHLLYTLGNPTAGIYDNKIEKFFRQDFLMTKYPWYILDPYKEERDAFEKFGAAYPKTEQMFKDIPMFGHLLSATVGEVIKPTRYIAEELWKVGDNMMKNPGYNPNDPTSPEFIRFEEPNKMVSAFFDFVEDYKTFSGMHGYLLGKTTESFFGTTNPYKDDVVLDSIDNDINMISRYERLELGGMFGTTEGIRRLLDGESLGTISMNPLEQRLPDWMPEFFRKGKNPYMKNNFGEYILPGEAFDETSNATGNEDLDRMKTLSMIAPYSAPFDDLKRKVYSNFDALSKKEQQSFYESLGYAGQYGKREYDDKQAKAENVINKTVKIDKKISYNEFISDGKRYKIDNVEDDFNDLTHRIGAKKARNKIQDFDSRIVEGSEYNFKMSTDAQYSVGMDRDGDFIKVASDLVSDDIKGSSVYNNSKGILSTLATPITTGFNIMAGNAMTSDLEKVFGKKTAYKEWSQETVQSPYFRDWDNMGSSFIEPYFNFSSNSLISSLTLGRASSDIFINSGANLDAVGGLITAGRFNMIKNKLTGGFTRSESYEDDAEVNRELQKIKAVSGDKSYFNMNGKENLKQIQGMVNENDATFIEDLINTTNSKERASILNEADDITANVLKQVWNRHQELVGNQNNDKMYEIEKETFDEVIDIGAYVGDSDQARLALKSALNIGKSKLDAKRIGVISSYRGGMGMQDAEIIKQRMYKGYNSKSVTSSTIYPNGTINVNRRD